MIQPVFTQYLSQPIPIAPRDRDGLAIEPDGDIVMDIDDSSRVFGIDPIVLNDLYMSTIGPFLTPDDAKAMGLPLPRLLAATKRTIQPQDLQVLREMYPGLKDVHMAMMVAMANRRGLDPMVGQILPKYTREPGTKASLRFTIITKVESFRIIASRTGRYQGPSNTKWLCQDGKWKDVWDGDDHPIAAKAGIYTKGRTRPIEAVARWESYVQFEQSEQDDSRMMAWSWQRMPDTMIEKCAEAKALRKAFPEDLGGLYTADEMGQADNPPEPPKQKDDAQDDPSDESRYLLNEETGEVISAEAKIPTELSEPELRQKLVELGADDSRQTLLIDMFKRKMWSTFKAKPSLFYAAVYDKVKENPAMYWLKVG